MSIVLVLLAVAVVAAALMVASGRGEAMADAPPDRSPEPLPDGPIAAADVSDLRFGVGLRGYRMDEVDRVVDRLVLELEWRDARIAELERAAGAGLSPGLSQGLAQGLSPGLSQRLSEGQPDRPRPPRHLGDSGERA